MKRRSGPRVVREDDEVKGSDAEPPTREDGAKEMKTESKVGEFEWSYTEEPHASRRKAIRAKYGKKVSALEGVDHGIKWQVLVSVTIQMMAAFFVSSVVDSWLCFFVTMYVVGGTCNNHLGLSLHELSHGLAFKKFKMNTYFGIFANLPLTIPISVSFRRYHLEHHRYQGEDKIDSDIPSAWELSMFRSAPMKLLWVFLNPAFYAIRPLFVIPKIPQMLEFVNVSIQIVFDIAVYYFMGWKALLYLFLSTAVGYGLHPCAGHFIAEHYTFLKGHETYSYYGPLNYVMFNVGYHNEHHDFPRIPGSRLPQLRALAPEFYDDLPHHMSYFLVFYNYIFDPTVGPWSRVKRATVPEKELKMLMNES